MRSLQKVKNGMGSPDWNVSMVNIHLRNLLQVYCPGHAGVKGNDRADSLAEKSNHHRGLASRNILNVEELETLLAGHKSQGYHTIDRLEERSVQRGSARRSSLKGRGPSSVRQILYWNCFKCDGGETSDRRDGAHTGFSERIETILN